MTCKITKGVKVSVEPRYEGNFESKEGNIDGYIYVPCCYQKQK